MSATKNFVSFVLLVLLTFLCTLEGKPTLHTKDKGVSLPIMPSTVNKSWCRSALFKERITAPGCNSKLVYNRFCYGQCMSFFVPRYPQVNFRSCNACAPVVTEKRFVQLDCPKRKNPIHLKEIILVKSCRCRSDLWGKTKSTGKKST